MIRRFGTLVVVLVLFAVSGVISANSLSPIIAPKPPGEVVIDGDLSDWILDNPMVMGQKQAGSSGLLDETYLLHTTADGNRGDSMDEIDYRLTAYFMWDKDYLYVAGVIEDDCVVEFDPWQGCDRVELFLNGLPDRGEGEYPAADFEHANMTYRILWRAVPIEDPSNPYIMAEFRGRPFHVIGGSDIAVVVADDGWRFEVKIAWRGLARLTPSASTEYGVFILGADADSNEDIGDVFHVYRYPLRPTKVYDWANMARLVLHE